MEYFIAELTCLDCGNTSAADPSTNMSTHLRDEFEPRSLPIGEVVGLELTPEHMDRSGYQLIQLPTNSTIRILESWECPSCPGYKWATIEVGDGVIRAITATRLDRPTFQASHYLSDEAIDIAKMLTGLPYKDLVAMDIVEILREKL